MPRTRRKNPEPQPSAATPRDQNRRARLSAIEQAALPLYLARGLDAVTVDDITARAGIAKGSFYRYHADQEALVTWLCAPLGAALRKAFLLAAQTLETSGSAQAALMGALTQLALAHPERVRLYLQESRGPAFGPRRAIAALSAEIARHALTLTRTAQSNGALAARVDARAVSLALVGAVERLLLAALSGEELGDPVGAAESLWALVREGARPPARRSSGRASA